jgi:large subunit ribosomal protein L24
VSSAKGRLLKRMGTRRMNLYAKKDERDKRPRAEDLVRKWHICKGDTVEVLVGKDAGKQGVVRRVLRSENRLVVRGVNLVKKPIPKRQAAMQPGTKPGTLLTIEAPVHYSNVALVDPTTKQPTKVVLRSVPHPTDATRTTRVRVSRQTGVVIEKAKFITGRMARVPKVDSPLDTPPDVVLKRSFVPASLLPWPQGVQPADWRPRIAAVASQQPKPDHQSLWQRYLAKKGVDVSQTSASSSAAAAASSSSAAVATATATTPADSTGKV